MERVELLVEQPTFKASWLESSIRETQTEVGRDFTVVWASSTGVEHFTQHKCEVGRTSCSDGNCSEALNLFPAWERKAGPPFFFIT